MTEQGEKSGEIVGVFAEGVIVGDGLRFGVDDEFVGIAAASFAIESGAPLAEDCFEFFGGNFSELCHGFDAECSKSALGDFADAGNFPNGKRREKFCLLAGRYPDESAG